MPAEYVDKKYALLEAGVTQVKENIMQPVCVHGVGLGKSALLSNGLDLHKKYCQDKDLLELLKDEIHPLAIHISFNSMTPFDSEDERNVALAVIRRILAGCLKVEWNIAKTFPLSDTLTINECIEAIMAYHKKVHGMRNDQKVFIYLAIDEINQLVRSSKNKSVADISLLKVISRLVQGLHSPNGFVSTVFAGTHFADMNRSFLGSGISPLNLELTRLSEETIESILVRDAGVSQHYIEHPRFQKLLRSIGYRLRGIGIAVKELESEFNVQSIDNAEAAVDKYLNFNNSCVLSQKELEVLIGLATTGRSSTSPFLPILPGALVTLDGLQNDGVIDLVPHPNGGYSVFMSRITLKAFLNRSDCDRHLQTSIDKLLGFIDTHGPDSFEKFVADFHAFKKDVFFKNLLDRIVSIDSFYSGALIGNDLMQLELQLKPTSFHLEFPNGVMWLTGGRYPESKHMESEGVTNHLKNGGVVLNSKGAAVDVLVGESVRETSGGDWQNYVIAYGMKHTIFGDTELKGDEVIDDYNKAVKALGESKNHSKGKTIMVHFSNRELSEGFNSECLKKLNGDLRGKIHEFDWKSMQPTSILVHRGNIESVVGPMFGRLLNSKGFYMSAENTKKRPFSTLARAVPMNCVKKEFVSAIRICRLLR